MASRWSGPRTLELPRLGRARAQLSGGNERTALERGDSLEHPVARDAADGIRRDSPEPDWLRHADPASEPACCCGDRKDRSDEQQLSDLDPDVKEEQRDRDRPLRQADLCQGTGKPEPVQQPEREG